MLKAVRKLVTRWMALQCDKYRTWPAGRQWLQWLNSLPADRGWQWGCLV